MVNMDLPLPRLRLDPAERRRALELDVAARVGVAGQDLIEASVGEVGPGLGELEVRREPLLVAPAHQLERPSRRLEPVASRRNCVACYHRRVVRLAYLQGDLILEVSARDL